MNVITSLWTSISHQYDENYIPNQTTRLKCITPVRSLDIDFMFRPLQSQCNVINIPDPIVETIKPVHNTSTSFFDWFTTPSTSSNNNNNKTNSSMKTNNESNRSNLELDQQEREFYMSKIKELQDKIFQLENLQNTNL